MQYTIRKRRAEEVSPEGDERLGRPTQCIVTIKTFFHHRLFAGSLQIQVREIHSKEAIEIWVQCSYSYKYSF